MKGHAVDADRIARAHDFAHRGEWQAAYALIAGVDAKQPLEGPELVFLAEMAYAAGHLEVTIETWERAHAETLAAGDHLGAAGAAVRVALHLVMDTGLMAPVRGWLARAERLLDGRADTPVHAWMSVARLYERLLSGDLKTAMCEAERAIAVGEQCEPAAGAVGRIAQARILILQGEVARGLRQLNEAAVAIVSGEIDPIATGIVYCEVVCAFHALAHHDAAEEWTAAMERWRHGRPVGGIHGRCRLHRAEILRLRGSEEAEPEALRACEELRPYMRREFGWPLTELGRIRLQKGDLEGAEAAFVEAHESGWDPEPGLALVHLARGDVEAAVASIREALERPRVVPSKEWPPHTDLRRAPLLEARVRIELAAGELAHARAAAEELARVASCFQSKGLEAGACLARGRVQLAEGDAAHALETLAEAVQAWTQIGAPYEMALARRELGLAYRASGQEKRASLELAAADSILERIGAVHPEGLAKRVTEHRAGRGQAEPAAAANTSSSLRREGDYWSVRFDEKTVRIRDLKGLHYLVRLLGAPGEEIHALELARSSDASTGEAAEIAHLATSDAGELLDARAKEAYRRRLAEIEEDIELSRASGDLARLEQAEEEREFLVRELARAVGLGGRDRRAGEASERARVSVTRAMRQAMARLAAMHPSLGEHLQRTIRTGTCCSYLPDPRAPVAWQTEP